jgi:hypothetical protein
VQKVIEGKPPVAHEYGRLSVWLPGGGAPQPIGMLVSDFTVSRDGSAVVYFDFDAASQSASGRLKAVSLTACSPSCTPVVLASGVTLAQVSFRIDKRGRLLVVAAPGNAQLVDLVSGQTKTLSTASTARSAMLTPNGDTLGWVEGLNDIKLAPTATPDAVTAMSSFATAVDSALLVDTATLIAKERGVGGLGPANSSPVLVKLTRDSVTTLKQQPLDYFLADPIARGTDGFIFFSRGFDSNTGTSDLWVIDVYGSNAAARLATASATPIASAVIVSDDGTSALYKENYNLGSARGDQFVLQLKTGQKRYLGNLRQAAFVPGSTALLYVHEPDLTTLGGVLTLLPDGSASQVESVGVINFATGRGQPARTYFTRQSGLGGDGVWYLPSL